MTADWTTCRVVRDRDGGLWFRDRDAGWMNRWRDYYGADIWLDEDRGPLVPILDTDGMPVVRTVGDLTTPKDVARFFRKVDLTDPAGCWLWAGAKNDMDYGQMWIEGRVVYAYRACYERLVGEIPDGLFLDHICHRPACVNPDHLRPVTNKQNQEHRMGAQSNSKSGIRGVSYDSRAQRWCASVGHGGARRRKNFAAREDAERQVIAWRAELFTHDDWAGEVLP